MIDLKTALLSRILASVVEKLNADPADASAWEEAREALEATGEQDAEVRAAVDGRDRESLGALVEAWSTGSRSLPDQDRAVLKRALKAYKKRLKLTRLDAESKLGVGPMTKGDESSIIGIKPPEQYPPEIWELLVRQGRMIDAGHGTLELPRE